MRPGWLVLSLLGACAERGELVVDDDASTDESGVPDTDTPAETDEPAPDTDTDGDDTEVPDTDEPVDTDDPGEGPVPSTCGPERLPPEEFLGSVSRVVLGEARLQRGFDFTNPWSWSGCEVERFFDEDGAWLCDIVRTVSGNGSDELFADPGTQFALTFTVDGPATSCANALALSQAYGVNIELPRDNKVELFRKPASNWQKLGSFTAGGNPNDVRFSYSLPFVRQSPP